MATIGGYRWISAETQDLADLGGVLHDLSTARDLIREALDAPAKFGSPSLRDERMVAALVAYGRAFATGRRLWDREAFVGALTYDERLIHEGKIAMRNKFIAHPVNTMEHDVPTVQIRTDEQGHHEIQDVNVARVSVAGLLGDELRAWLAVLERGMARVRLVFNAERARLLEIARKRDPGDFLDGGLPGRMEGMGDPHKERPQRRRPRLPRRK